MAPWLLRTRGEVGGRRVCPLPVVGNRGNRKWRSGAQRARQGRREWGTVAGAAATTLGLLLSAAVSHAHDFWIEPGTFRPTQSQVTISLRVGDSFPGEPFPRDPTHVERFVVVGPRGEATVAGRPGWDPAGYAPLVGSGVHVIGYLSAPQSIVLEGAAFDAYVAKEALEHVINARAAVSTPEAPVREQFSRCAKSLVWFGEPHAGGGDVVLGFPLELVAETNPYGTAPGDAIAVRLLYRGRLLAGAKVSARSPTDPEAVLAERTDRDGRVVFRLPRGGFWLLRAIHMLPSSVESGADWESLWASLTFPISPKRD